MSEGNDRRVAEYLSRGLDCEVQAERPEGRSGAVFVPAGDGFGQLQVGDDLLSLDESKLLARLRRDGVDELLRKGERVRVTETATEILPRR